MDHLLDSIPIVRIHELDEGGWTYTNKNKGNRYYTWIDHMYANTGFRRGVHTMSVADNMLKRETRDIEDWWSSIEWTSGCERDGERKGERQPKYAEAQCA